MKELLILTIGLLIPALNFGQSELAIVNDSNEFLNVRANTSSESEISFRINEGDSFHCGPTYKNWWEIKNSHTQTGFVHKSEIQLIKDLSEEQQRNLIINSIYELQAYRVKYDSLYLILPDKEKKELLKEFKNFEESVYLPLLPFFTQLFCKNRDIGLLKKYLDVMIVNEMSAKELPASYLGYCYLCHPDIVLKRINKYYGNHSDYLWKMLVFGFRNITWQKDNEIENYQELKDKLYNPSNLYNITSESRDKYQDLIFNVVDTLRENNYWIITAKGQFEETIVGINIKIKNGLKPGLYENGRLDNRNWAIDALEISTIGEESDNFVRIISELYGETTEKEFTDKPLIFTCFSLNTETAILENGYYKFKLYFDDTNESGLYTEVFLNINLPEGYIEIPDKNPQHRGDFIRAMVR